MRVEDFYEFMIKRENLRLKKEAGEPWPWTDDKILQTYKFTNVKRAHDRTTKWFWDVLDQHRDHPPDEQLFNCALFRYFGTIEFYDCIGWQSNWTKHEQKFVKFQAEDRLKRKQRVFTGAYVITNQGISAPKQEVVVDYFLTPFWEAAPKLTRLAQSTGSWEAVAKEMMKLQGFGGSGFMTKEILQDALHTSVFPNCTDRNTYCPIGPGAKRGLNRVYSLPIKEKRSDKQMLKELVALFGHRSHYWPDNYVELELHDIQFQLCEFDKYERVKLGEGRPRSKYRRRK
jgi:hypothetical protein